jgi:small-conductance mechanosensitive channel
MDTISHVTDKIKSAFDEHGIEIPYPKRDITISHRQASESDTRQPVSEDKTS